jgi:hypothetical protein
VSYPSQPSSRQSLGRHAAIEQDDEQQVIEDAEAQLQLAQEQPEVPQPYLELQTAPRPYLELQEQQEPQPYFGQPDLGNAVTQPIPTGVVATPPANLTTLWVVFGSAVAAFIASFMPWVKFTFLGLSIAGVDRGDGWFSVALSAAVASYAYWRIRRPGFQLAWAVLALAGTVGLTALAIVEVIFALGNAAESEFTGMGSPGVGLWLLLAAGLTGSISLVRASFGDRSKS